MSNTKVVVHDIEELERFKSFLELKRDETENLYNCLDTESCEQGENWQDPQYDEFKNKMDDYLANARKQLDTFDDAIDYVIAKLEKLHAI